MKVIELLNKITNDEEVPKRIRILFNEFYYDELNHKYRNDEFGQNDLLEHLDFYKGTVLNSDIEILEDISEEKPKEDKKIERLSNVTIYGETISSLRNELQATNRRFEDKINEIIDKINGE